MIDPYTGKKIVSPLDLPDFEKVEHLLNQRKIVIKQLSDISSELSDLGVSVKDMKDGVSWQIN